MYPSFLKVITLDNCESTNTYLKSQYQILKEFSPVLVTSNQQTAGRGRDTRTWVSSRGKGLYSTFGFRLNSTDNVHLLPLTVGISVIKTLHTLCDITGTLKWPNDILFNRKKLAGILIENIFSQNEIFCIAGIGINLNHTTLDFPPHLEHKAISLKMITGRERDYRADEFNPTLAEIIFQWIEKMKIDSDQIIDIANHYVRFMISESITFHQSTTQEMMKGIFKGIHRSGGAVIELENGDSTIYYSGEIV